MAKSINIKWLYILLLVIITLLIIGIIYWRYAGSETYKIKRKYSQIKNWQDAKELFQSDLDKNELKYFYFGLGDNPDMDTLETKYNLDVIFMGDLISTNYILYDYYVSTMIIKNNRFKLPYRSISDSIWDYFVRAMETSDIEYLIANSFDSINCSELGVPSGKNDEVYESEFIFNNHLDKLMHLDNLSTHRQDIYETDSTLDINYQIKCPNAEEGGYNLIFFFKKRGDKYLFSGMILT
jgi:hypothetical protein